MIVMQTRSAIRPLPHLNQNQNQIKLRFHRKSWAGMDVALFKADLGRVSDPFQEGDFDHALDNSGDSFGLVADWVAITRRRRFDSPAARRSGCDSDYQPRNGPTRCLIISCGSSRINADQIGVHSR
jgi:hypothetical protein